jgi:chromosome segregation ATPase
MHIKRVTVKNFVSYEDQPQVVVSPGLNLLLGLNGSGKSNFLQGK